ncbi:hypothetical protein LX32DRAFT_698932 [Colletotrichum zoysiae]|uniref:Uncharacterized protein n=1 Tax=Colletotrichum zoysiae TaxID=1216348 RepID=A0AAD9H419_9PEZI|nr:hypothetical protein LX32DRAFT_698932 [Colletotrichum zoysiae]
MASPTALPGMKPSSPLSRVPVILRLDIAYHLIREPNHLGTSVGLRDVANLAATPREWKSLVTPLLYTEGVLADCIFYAAGGGLANVKWHSDMERVVDHASLLSPAFNITGNSLLLTEFVVAWRCSSNLLPIQYQRDLFTNGVSRATLLHPAIFGGKDDVIRWTLDQQGVHVDQPAHLGCLCPSTDRFAATVGGGWGLLPMSPAPVTALNMAILRGDDRASKLLMVGRAVWDHLPSRAVSRTSIVAANNAVESIKWLASAPEARRLRRDGRVLFHNWPDDSGRSSFHRACLAKQVSKDNAAVSRLTQALFSLGALVVTDDMEEVSRRLESETQLLRHGVVLGQHSGDSDWAWASRLERGGIKIKELWASGVSPVEYAASRKNYCMATAMAYAAILFPWRTLQSWRPKEAGIGKLMAD